MPMLIPLMYFMSLGYKFLLDKLIKNDKIQQVVYVAGTVFFAVLSIYVYAVIFYPEYGLEQLIQMAAN